MRVMDLVAPPGGLFVRDICHQTIADVDPLDHEDPILFFDFSPHSGRESSVACRYPARLQRASEGTGQSATRGGHDVIERRSEFFFRLDSVMFGDGAVHAEHRGLGSGGKVGTAHRAFHTFDADVRRVDHFAHRGFSMP